jgi:hypothetical protein
VLVYAVRGLTIGLAIFVLTYAGLRLLVTAGWAAAERWLFREPSKFRPNTLYVLQVGPFLLSLLAVAIFAVPAFLKFEPRGGAEEFGTPVVVLSLLALILLAASSYRAAIAYLDTARFVRSWKREAVPVQGTTLPMYRTNADAPPLVVAGLLRPKLLVSAATSSLLNESELARAIAHESAHIRNHDNAKKLALRLLSYPSLGSMEQRWLSSLEIEADQSAVRSKREALDLASALVKSSRLSIATPELVTNLASPAGALLHTRVERLLAWQESEQTSRYSSLAVMSIATALAYLVVSRYDLLLWLMHEVAEFLMR